MNDDNVRIEGVPDWCVVGARVRDKGPRSASRDIQGEVIGFDVEQGRVLIRWDAAPDDRAAFSPNDLVSLVEPC